MITMPQKTDIEITALLNIIYDASLPLLANIAPDGWAKSEYVRFLHPTAQQQHDEQKRLAENLKNMKKLRANNDDDETEEPDINSLKQDDLDSINELDEFRYITGIAIYHIFSNNHEVYADNEVYDMGSARGSGGFIADFLNEKFNYIPAKYDYLDFYMGALWIEDRASFLPFYEHVFQVLKNEHCDWNYSFPRLYLIDFGNNNDAKENDNMADYSPGQALAKEMEEKERQKEVNELKEKFDASFNEEYEEAKYKPLPEVVQAYKNIFGVLPAGHPQKEFE